jgi:adenylate kinase
MMSMKRIGVVIYGPPGSGKSTQADLVANRYGLIRFDTGKYIESELYDPKNANDPLIARERERYEAGLLCDKPWVLSIVSRELRAIISAGYGVVLAGSPRTTFEAFDEAKTGVYSILKDGYGLENVYTITLKVKAESSMARNTTRKLCTVCNRQYLYSRECPLEHCPFCAAGLRTRSLDKPEVIEERLEEFKRETSPILEGIKKMGFKTHEVDAEVLPYQVFEQICRWLPS